MLQYLVILLDDTSTSYCHADNPYVKRNLIPLDTLRKAIVWGMKHNLMIQYIYPNYELPNDYNAVIESIDNVKIVPESLFGVSKYSDKDSVIVVYDSVPTSIIDRDIVVRLTIGEILEFKDRTMELFKSHKRLSICITDIEKFKDEQIPQYRNVLNTWVKSLSDLILNGEQPDLNIILDRIKINEMHNCNAGIENITIAPNGKFYLCPSFYYDELSVVRNQTNNNSVGDLTHGLTIPNRHLLQLDHSPICRMCDAYHCNRCIWLNYLLTTDINTPSHQQCVISHLERNASKKLLRNIGDKSRKIKTLHYIDPFDTFIQHQ